MLAGAAPYALAALSAAAPQLRRLGAKQLGRMLLVRPQTVAQAGANSLSLCTG